jgi:hypothetical protein
MYDVEEVPFLYSKISTPVMVLFLERELEMWQTH